ncbi:MAG: DUF2948 family protein [Sphingomonadales bacterium]|nr:DUF2948 family protein [Sphingomonadales bacterium]
MEQIKLIAFDAEDLAVISAHVQNASLKVQDMAYMPGQKRFAAVASRLDWTCLIEDTGRSGQTRFLSALRLDRVLGAKLMGIDLSRKDETLTLLAMQFTAKSAGDPEGFITLFFADGGAVRLHVECVEVELRDLEHLPDQPDAAKAKPSTVAGSG